MISDPPEGAVLLDEKEKPIYETGLASEFGAVDINNPNESHTGAWDNDITSRNIAGVALPASTLTQRFGNPKNALGAMVEVQISDTGKTGIFPVVDIGPGDSILKRQGPTIDLTAGAREALGHSGGLDKARWRFVDDKPQGDIVSDPPEDAKPLSQQTSAQPQGQGGVITDPPEGSKLLSERARIVEAGSGTMPSQQWQDAVNYASSYAGVTTSIAHGIEGGHSKRHQLDQGQMGAADVDLHDATDGHKLDADNPEDRYKMARYIEAAVSMGAKGIGFGNDYMGSSRIHVGGGPGFEGVWGAQGKSANAYAWVKAAYNQGLEHGKNAVIEDPPEGSVPVDDRDNPIPQDGQGKPATEQPVPADTSMGEPRSTDYASGIGPVPTAGSAAEYRPGIGPGVRGGDVVYDKGGPRRPVPPEPPGKVYRWTEYPGKREPGAPTRRLRSDELPVVTEKTATELGLTDWKDLESGREVRRAEFAGKGTGVSRADYEARQKALAQPGAEVGAAEMAAKRAERYPEQLPTATTEGLVKTEAPMANLVPSGVRKFIQGNVIEPAEKWLLQHGPGTGYGTELAQRVAKEGPGGVVKAAKGIRTGEQAAGEALQEYTENPYSRMVDPIAFAKADIPRIHAELDAQRAKVASMRTRGYAPESLETPFRYGVGPLEQATRVPDVSAKDKARLQELARKDFAGPMSKEETQEFKELSKRINEQTVAQDKLKMPTAQQSIYQEEMKKEGDLIRRLRQAEDAANGNLGQETYSDKILNAAGDQMVTEGKRNLPDINKKLEAWNEKWAPYINKKWDSDWGIQFVESAAANAGPILSSVIDPFFGGLMMYGQNVEANETEITQKLKKAGKPINEQAVRKEAHDRAVDQTVMEYPGQIFMTKFLGKTLKNLPANFSKQTAAVQGKWAREAAEDILPELLQETLVTTPTQDLISRQRNEAMGISKPLTHGEAATTTLASMGQAALQTLGLGAAGAVTTKISEAAGEARAEKLKEKLAAQPPPPTFAERQAQEKATLKAGTYRNFADIPAGPTAVEKPGAPAQPPTIPAEAPAKAPAPAAAQEVVAFRGEPKGPSAAGQAHGVGEYYGLTEETAQRFSKEGTVKQSSLTLANPLTVNSDAELRAVREEAGVQSDPRMLLSKKDATQFTEHLQNKGYDSFITNYAEAPGGKQAIVFPKAAPAAAGPTIPPVAPAKPGPTIPATPTAPAGVAPAEEGPTSPAEIEAKVAEYQQVREGKPSGAPLTSAVRALQFEDESGLSPERAAGLARLESSVAADPRSGGKPVKLIPQTRGVGRSKESKALNNAIDGLERLFNKRVQFVRSATGENLPFTGVIDPGDPNTIFLDAAGDRNVLALVGHEWSHTLKVTNPALHAEMVEHMKPLVKEWAAQEAKLRKDEGYPEKEVSDEVASNIVGDGFTSPKFWKHLNKKNPSLFRKVVNSVNDFFKSLIKRARGSEWGTEEFVSNLESMHKVIADAVHQAVTKGPEPKAAAPREAEGPKFAPRETKEGKPSLKEAMEGVKGEQLKEAMGGLKFVGRQVETKPEAKKEISVSGPSRAEQRWDMMIQRMADEDLGHDILDHLIAEEISPQSVVQRFWKETYSNLPDNAQRKFQRYIQKFYDAAPGEQIGNTKEGKKVFASDWQDIAPAENFPSKAQHLQGEERGLVVLMQMANEGLGQLKQAAPGPTVLSIEAPMEKGVSEGQPLFATRKHKPAPTPSAKPKEESIVIRGVKGHYEKTPSLKKGEEGKEAYQKGNIHRMYEPVPDTLRESGAPALARAIEQDVDDRAAYMGKWGNRAYKALPLWMRVKKYTPIELAQETARGALNMARRLVSMKTRAGYMSKEEAEFSNYIETEQKHGSAAADKLGISPAARKMVDTIHEIFDEMGTEAETIKTMNRNPNTGKWELFKKRVDPGRRYFPHILRKDIRQAIQNGAMDVMAKEELKQAMIDEGIIPPGSDDSVFTKHIDNFMARDRENGFMGSLEHKRTRDFPHSAYDYSYATALDYIKGASERMAQIKAYGQGKGGKSVSPEGTLFDREIRRAGTEHSREYIELLRDVVFGGHNLNPVWKGVAGLRNLGVATQLATLRFTVRNLTFGMAHNYVSARGLPGVAEARFLWSLPKTFLEIKDGYERGNFMHDIMNVQHDGEVSGSWAQTTGKVAGVSLRTVGAKALETLMRGNTLAIARMSLRRAMKVYGKNPKSIESRQFLGWLKRLGFEGTEGHDLIVEGGEGPLFDRYMRRAVNRIQGGYSIADSPLFLNTPEGKAALQYSKWSVEQTNRFAKDIVNPLVRAVTLGKFKKDTVQIINPDGTKETVPVPGEILTALRYIFGLAAGGAGGEWLLEKLLGVAPQTVRLANVMKTWREDQWAGFLQGLSKFSANAMQAGFGGYLSNIGQEGWDVYDKRRYKDPFSMPSVQVLKNMRDAGLNLFDEKNFTPEHLARRLDEFIETTVGGYRDVKNVAAGVNDVFGGDFRAMTSQYRQIQLSKVRSLVRRYEQEMGAAEKTRQEGRFGKTEKSPFRDAFHEDLVMKDTKAAQARMNKEFSGMSSARKELELKELKTSMAAKLPIKVGNGSKEELAQFKAWAKKNALPSEYDMVLKIDNDYKAAAHTVLGIEFEEPTAQSLQDYMRLQKIKNEPRKTSSGMSILWQ